MGIFGFLSDCSLIKQITILKQQLSSVLTRGTGFKRGKKNEKGLDGVVYYTITYYDVTTYAVEEVRTGKKELALNTFYKKRKPGGLVPTENGIPPLTSETTPDSSEPDL